MKSLLLNQGLSPDHILKFVEKFGVCIEGGMTIHSKEVTDICPSITDKPAGEIPFEVESEKVFLLPTGEKITLTGVQTFKFGWHYRGGSGIVQSIFQPKHVY